MTTAPECAWREDEVGLWHTACGHIFEFFDGAPSDNKFVYCPYCGKPIREERYDEQPEYRAR